MNQDEQDIRRDLYARFNQFAKDVRTLKMPNSETVAELHQTLSSLLKELEQCGVVNTKRMLKNGISSYRLPCGHVRNPVKNMFDTARYALNRIRSQKYSSSADQTDQTQRISL